MYLERLLQINMATLAALGALLLGMGQRSEGPPLLVIVAAASSVWLTDVHGWIRIGRWTADFLMLVGAVISLRDLFPLQSEVQAIGLSWFLIYLQIILLFQKKDERAYWLLVMLSLLQVVVATLFSQGIWFGVLLAIYMLLGFSAMTLLMIYRQWEHFAKGSGSADQEGASRDQGEATGPPPSPRPSFLARAGSSRWPLLAESPEFVSLPGGSNRAGVGRDLFGRLGKMGLHTLALSLVLFFAVPRFGQVGWRGPLARPQPLVGFTDKVQLGQLGSIITSRDKVMEVAFFRRSGDVPQPLHGEVYLQGAYLMRYQDGQWSVGQVSTASGSPFLQRERSLPWSEIVQQKIKIEALDRNELFYAAPYIATQRIYPDITVDDATQRLERAEHLCSQRFEYTIGTTAIVDGEQLPLSPAAASEITNDRRAMPAGGLPNLAQLAKRWIDEAGLPKKDRVGRARFLEQKLANSGQFEYSLAEVNRNSDIDPIEDFVTEHRQGHCEYFATALTLMLRSQGISARMVSGFKIDNSDWNAMGGYYQVRQLHAHTWVEVYLEPSQIPAKLRHGEDYWTTSVFGHTQAQGGRSWSEGGWLRLDPTPAGAGGEEVNWLTPLRHGLDWLDTAWSKYVVELDTQRQRDAIYQPIVNAVRSAWQKVTSAQQWREMFDSMTVALYLDRLGREAKWALLAVVGVVLAALAAGIGWLLVHVGRRLRAHRMGNHAHRRGGRRIEIAFYRRFEGLMARQGLLRAPAQTQHEFAAAAGKRLVSLTGDGRLATLPALIADAFYCVRFGRMPLDNLQTQAVEQALVELATIHKNH